VSETLGKCVRAITVSAPPIRGEARGERGVASPVLVWAALADGPTNCAPGEARPQCVGPATAFGESDDAGEQGCVLIEKTMMRSIASDTPSIGPSGSRRESVH
jgi:hypothetical protein